MVQILEKGLVGHKTRQRRATGQRAGKMETAGNTVEVRGRDVEPRYRKQRVGAFDG